MSSPRMQRIGKVLLVVFALACVLATVAFAEGDAVLPEPTACIRCGRCVLGCPMDLMPTQLEKYAELGDVDALNRYGVMCCMECGTCAYNCPANRPLVQAIRMGKALVKKGGKQ